MENDSTEVARPLCGWYSVLKVSRLGGAEGMIGSDDRVVHAGMPMLVSDSEPVIKISERERITSQNNTYVDVHLNLY